MKVAATSSRRCFAAYASRQQTSPFQSLNFPIHAPDEIIPSSCPDFKFSGLQTLLQLNYDRKLTGVVSRQAPPRPSVPFPITLYVP